MMHSSSNPLPQNLQKWRIETPSNSIFSLFPKKSAKVLALVPPGGYLSDAQRETGGRSVWRIGDFLGQGEKMNHPPPPSVKTKTITQ